MSDIHQFSNGEFAEAGNYANRMIIEPPPEGMTLAGNASVDGAFADGIAANNVTFTAADKDAKPIAVYLQLTSASTTAALSANTISTDKVTGTATISLTDTVIEAVAVSAAVVGSTVTATATANFTDPAPVATATAGAVAKRKAVAAPAS